MNTNESKSEALSGPTDFDIIAGGREVEILGPDKKKQTVFVRMLPLKLYPALLAALTDEGRQAELFCDKPEGWAAELNPVAHDAIMQAGEALNRVPFSKWFARQTARTEMLAPGKMQALLKEAVQQATNR